MAELVIETSDSDGATRVALSGEFDLAAIKRFEEAIAEAEAGSPSAIVIDLRRLEFMDSSGLRALVMAHERAKNAGRRLTIVPGPPQVRRVFEITHLDDQLELVDEPQV